MKRLIISIGIVAAILVLSAMNIFTLYQAKEELTQALDILSAKLEQSGPASVVEDTQTFQQLWLEKEKKLIRFIRHADLEQITWDAARLPYLARYEDMAELTAEINRIRLQIDHLWETQLPHWRTVF